MADEDIQNLEEMTIKPIGYVNSPYKEKFAIPRQPGIVNAAKGTITLIGRCNTPDAVRDLKQFSHLWVVFIFHDTQEHGWNPLVRPPRLGGNKKTGVLATRSTFRPNPIGLSVVKLDKVELLNQNIVLSISGMDLLDKTPVVDIKPYIPYADSHPDAIAGYAQQEPSANLPVYFTDKAQEVLTQYINEFPELSIFITQVLSQDPRPAYKKSKLDDKVYGMTLYHFDVQWQMIDLESIKVINIKSIL